jgi:murein DD-endopeptidase MepM/ murein hydrolase activator NlpD
MKKVVITLATLFITISIILIPSSEAASSAKTLQDLKNELASLKKQKSTSTSNKKQTESQISSAKNNIVNKQTEISNNQDKIAAAEAESASLEEEIAAGKEELSKWVANYQIENGNNVYLEYIFESTSFEDLVYRYAVMEQIMDYQDDLIESWKSKIEQNNQLKVELQEREKTLNSQIASLNTDIDNLGDKLSEIDDMILDIDAEISSVQSSISYYESIGCSLTESLDECVSVKGDSTLRRPLVKSSGVVSSFGYRTHPVTKVWKFHSGTDLSVAEGSNVYAIANGTVFKIVNKSSCGGNMVYIHHLVNGKKWTSTYMHLLTINVKLGQTVTSQTVIGLSGGKTTGYKYGGYDNCTTGAHLHLSLATGWYEKDYTSYTTYRSKLVDATKYIDLPSKGWTSR